MRLRDTWNHESSIKLWLLPARYRPAHLARNSNQFSITEEYEEYQDTGILSFCSTPTLQGAS